MRIVLTFVTIFWTTLGFCNSFFIKIAVDKNSYVTLTYKDTSEIATSDVKIRFIAKMISDNFFDPNSISKEYYNIVVKDNIKLSGKNVKQYDMIPIKKDRFTHIITSYGNLIVRREVYDTNNNLLYAYGYNETFPDIQPVQKEVKDINIEKEPLIYKGFVGKLVKKLEDGSIHYIFSDGLNKFSLFVKRIDKFHPEVKTVIYGNYLLSKDIKNIRYTVIGSIPFEEMEQFVSYILAKDKKR